MANTVIQLKKSGTPSSVPNSLANGELAINYADGKLFYKDSTGTIKTVSVDAYSTVNVGGSLLVADIPNDVLSIGAGDNITLTPDALTDTFTIAANLTAANNWANTKLSNTSGVVFDGNLTISTDLTIGNNLYSINSAFFDTNTSVTVTKGQISWNSTEETFDLGMANGDILQVGQEILYRVKNQTGSTITEGTVVMAAGTLGASGRIKVTPAISDGTYPSKYLMGIATTTMANGEDGYVTHFGKVRGIDTSMWSEGDILYANVSVAGGLQNTAPVAPNTKTTVAIVVSKHATTGTLFVRPTYGSKLNEDELVELHSLTNGDVLSYVTANGRFENKNTLINVYNLANAAFDRANSSNDVLFVVSAYDTANAGFNKANSANVLAKAAFDFANTLGGGGATVSATAPVSPSVGDLWWNTTYGRLLVYYNDGTSSQWVDATATASGARVVTTNTAPTGAVDGQLWWSSEYGRLFVYYNDGDTYQWVDANPAQSLTLIDNKANAVYTLANAAFDKANTGATYSYVNTSVIAANTWANTVGTSGNTYTNTVATSVNAYANVVGSASNTFAGQAYTVANSAFNTANAAATTGKAIAMAIVFGG